MEQRERVEDFTRAELLKKPENRLTAAEKLYLYGPPNSDVVMYRRIEEGGDVKIVSRLFKAGETIPEGWVDTPAKCGAKPTAPSREQRQASEYDAVVTDIEVEVEDNKPADKPAGKQKAA